MAYWIWLPEKDYPQQKWQQCRFSLYDNYADDGVVLPTDYTVVELFRDYRFDRPLSHIRLRVCSDTYHRLFVNGQAAGDGPVCAGNDYLCTHEPPAYFYQDSELSVTGQALHLRALVQLGPTAMCDCSLGHGGFFLEAELMFADGSVETVGTDETWLCRAARQHTALGVFDARQAEDTPVAAERRDDIWNAAPSRIPPMAEYSVKPTENGEIVVSAGETRMVEVPFAQIYAAFVCLDVNGRARVTADWYERPELWHEGDCERLITAGTCAHRALRYHSIGAIRLTVQNEDTVPITVRTHLIATEYPVSAEGCCLTSDHALNRVYALCRQTLRICRQTIHLDSPRHQEPLACTGDYLIDTMVTAATFGDMRLAAFDTVRIAQSLCAADGRLFHTSYSLLWAVLLREVYMLTGDKGLLDECRPALDLLLERFAGYIGENGLLEKAPDYMFIDWIGVDGFSLHHPPKYLGQTCLCMFYLGALSAAEKIYRAIDDPSAADTCVLRAAALRAAIEQQLYDSDRGLYFDGSPTPDAVPNGTFLPKNLPRRHFSRHANVLAVLYGACDGQKAKRILRTVLDDEIMPEVQPYFMYFVLEAVAKTGLTADYLLPLLARWKPMAAEGAKGLQEGWLPPNDSDSYTFDLSHAWGGAPAYRLPFSLLGLELVQPGFRAVRLHPQLYGMAFADVSVPTPFGPICCRMEQEKAPELTVPPQIKVL